MPLVWIVYWIVLVGTFQFVDQIDGSLEEVQPHQGRLATLPSHVDFPSSMTLQQLPEVGRQQILGHPEAAAGIQHLLGQKETVLAVEVADRAGRLDQNVESGRRIPGECKADVLTFCC